MNTFNNRKRFFAFGCSYTKYDYATWADLIGFQYEEYFNFGLAGCSNAHIMSKVIEANEIYRFDPNTDFIAVMLTGFGRFTYLPKDSNNWQAKGDLYSYNQVTGDPVTTEFVDKMWSDDWAVYQSWVALKAIKGLLDFKSVDYKVLMGIDNSGYLNGTAQVSPMMIAKTEDIYNCLHNRTSLDEWKRNNNYSDSPEWQDQQRVDGHPSTEIHLKFLEDYFPDYVNDYTREFVARWKENFDYSSQHNMGQKFDRYFRQLHDMAFNGKPSNYCSVRVKLPLLYDCVLPNTAMPNGLQTELSVMNYLHGMNTLRSRDHSLFEKPMRSGNDNETTLTYMFEKSYGSWPNTAPGTHLTAGPCMELVDADENSLYFGKRKYNRYIYPIKISPHIDAFSGAAYDGTKLAGNFFWKYMSSEALEDVRQGRAIIFLDYGQENFIPKSSYENLHIALSYSGIPPAQVVIGFNTFNAEEVYDSWFPKSQQKLIVKSWPFVISNTSYFYKETRQGRTEPAQFYGSKDTIRPNYFLFKIRRPRQHRQALAYMMNENNLLELGDWSWLSNDPYYETMAAEYSNRYDFKITDDKIKKLFKQLPKSLNDEPNDSFDTVSSWTDTQVKSYNNAYFYICTETYTEGPYKSVTEKICKPIGNYLPFLFVSFPGALQVLRDMGFKTFEGFIDESYDREQDTARRVKLIYREIEKLCAMTKQQLHDWYWSMEHILVHNREHLLTLYKQDQKTKDLIEYLKNRLTQ
jgi:hypothetical protein